MRSERLLSVLLLLQTRGRIPATELAERLEVSVRTIYRDVEALSATGVPVYAERGRHGGIALLPGYRTDVTGLTEDESRALFVLAAQGAHSALGLDRALGSALRKVMAALPEPHRPAAELISRRILVDPERWMATARPVADFDALSGAVLADRRLWLRYRRGGGAEVREYTVDPYGLVVKAGVWYLVADKAGEPRLFRADRVRSATVLDEPVRRRPGLELAEVWDSLRCRIEHRPRCRVTARVREERLELFLALYGGHVIGDPTPEPILDPTLAPALAPEPAPEPAAAPAGRWARVELGFCEPRDVHALLALGDAVEIVAPESARALLTDAATSVVALYTPAAP
ncbi:WYL domain-containing protein [Streptomyces sp. NPDC000594]|uniref:helix-turn-helix transcriptional regulator n=1 Tax=Streptomyces sp. NPDC000594 TaxID=3154261 RepID=UPI00332C25D6